MLRNGSQVEVCFSVFNNWLPICGISDFCGETFDTNRTSLDTALRRDVQVSCGEPVRAGSHHYKVKSDIRPFWGFFPSKTISAFSRSSWQESNHRILELSS